MDMRQSQTVSAMRIDPDTRAHVALPEEQGAVASAAANAVFSAAGVTPLQAAQSDFDRETWDMNGFPDDECPDDATFERADVWSAATAAARNALERRWPETDGIWIGLAIEK